MTARRALADDWPDYGPRAEPHESLPLFAPQTPGEVARDRVLAGFETNRPTVVAALRAEAWLLWESGHRPLSANDVRGVLTLLGYQGDHRILVAAFPKEDWMPVGFTKHNAPGNHARLIRVYVPRGSA